MNPLGSGRPRRDRPGQDQPGRPALGPLGQPGHVLGRQASPIEPFSSSAVSLTGELQLAHPQLGQLPLARIRASGSGGSSRVDSTTWTSAGRWSRNQPRVWWQIASVIRW